MALLKQEKIVSILILIAASVIRYDDHLSLKVKINSYRY